MLGHNGGGGVVGQGGSLFLGHAVGDAVQEGAGKHVARAVGVHRLGGVGGYFGLVAVAQDDAAFGAAGQAHGASEFLELGEDDFQIGAAAPDLSFFFVGEQVVQAVANHGLKASAAEVDHADVAEGEGGLSFVLDGDLSAFDSGFQPGGGGGQVAFHVIDLGLGDVVRVQRAGGELGRGTQKGAHGALGIWRDQNHAAARLTGMRLRVREVGGHAVGLQVLGIESTQLVIRHAAGIKRLAAQLRQRHNRVASRATTRAAGMQPLHMLVQSSALLRVDQRHVPLAHAHGLQQGVRDFVFRIDQRIANRVKVVVRHERTSENVDFNWGSDPSCLP